MPEISKFYGIIIYMYIDDHNPPHFHVWYDDYQAEITIKEGIVRGEMPRRALRLVFEWLDLHRDELLENWERGINIGGKEYDNKQSIAQSRRCRVRARLHTAPDVQHGRGAAGGLHAADAEGHLPQAPGPRILQVVPPRPIHRRLERRDRLRAAIPL